MSCKFKRMLDGCTKPYCYVTNGECQFLISPYDDKCEILESYRDLDPNDKELKQETKND